MRNYIITASILSAIAGGTAVTVGDILITPEEDITETVRVLPEIPFTIRMDGGQILVESGSMNYYFDDTTQMEETIKRFDTGDDELFREIKYRLKEELKANTIEQIIDKYSI